MDVRDMRSFTFSCIKCGKSLFTFDLASITNGLTPVATFVCPECGHYTAIQKRDGGGVLIATDLHANKPKTPPAPSGA